MSRSAFNAFGKFLSRNLNFYRIHLLLFTSTPLILSAVLYASSGRFNIAYIDALFICVGSMTMGGLTTIDLSLLTPWQQAILFIHMCLGSPVVVSWVMVFIRKYYFAKKFRHIIEPSASSKPTTVTAECRPIRKGWWKGLGPTLHSAKQDIINERETSDGIIQRLRPDMIRRIDAMPRPVNPSGGVSEGRPPSLKVSGIQMDAPRRQEQRLPLIKSVTVHDEAPASRFPVTRQAHKRRRNLRLSRRLSDPGADVNPPARADMPRSETVGTGIGARTQTIEFAPVQILGHRRGRPTPSPSLVEVEGSSLDPDSALKTSGNLRRHYSTTRRSLSTMSPVRKESLKNRGFGGFPMPLDILKRLMNRLFPEFNRKLARTLTMPRTTSLISGRADAPPGAKVVPYISFDAVVGRNSSFHLLTNEQLDEVGGVEYRALKALLWIVGFYHITIQIICFVVIAPYISQSRWAPNFVPPQLHRSVNPVWFSLFQVVSAYTNTGTSLVDQSMVPFQKAYPMIALVILLILAGNTAFPIFLRFTIWVMSKCVPRGSRLNETLHFLLDHPRRCFIYLFPSRQTWLLLAIVFLLTMIDWVFFLILDIGNTALSQLSPGLRVYNGLLQAATVRTAGFSAVPIAALAPAVKVLFVVTMYISVYPIAMSVRSTNVYEERSLGIFHDDDPDEGGFKSSNPRVTIWSKYLAVHAYRQLTFDIWWISLALFLICIIERGNITNPDNIAWFNIFNILFEVVSAYGTVGLTVGIPYANYSFSGAFHPLSKLIICLTMLRGRHRGLPVAIDRAVLLPSEFRPDDVDNNEDGDSTDKEFITEKDGKHPTNPNAIPVASATEKQGEDTDRGRWEYQSPLNSRIGSISEETRHIC
ncbi:hypothetical protein AX15_006779 [Amanita polypyramis BW_CC]|nr:hypothetical protein AX15_006779 [Amanita polypyramis BW_CC]